MDKLGKLNQIMKKYDSAIVAFSGGVDSSFLLKIAKDIFGEKVTAITADSPSLPAAELEAAKSLGKHIDVKHVIINTFETDIKEYKENNGQRCFYCKTELFEKLTSYAKKHQIDVIFEGSNFDDVSDYRPGMKAAENFGIQSPLKDAGLTKNEIREYSKNLELPSWDKPAFACLGSRFPYGDQISESKLLQVESAEDVLRNLGLNQFRVRHHQSLARIEVPPEDFLKIIKNKGVINRAFKKIGFNDITLDLQGFRSGALNKAISWTKK